MVWIKLSTCWGLYAVCMKQCVITSHVVSKLDLAFYFSIWDNNIKYDTGSGSTEKPFVAYRKVQLMLSQSFMARVKSFLRFTGGPYQGQGLLC